MYLIVGLGNPGDKYRYTKHNVGFMVLDYFASVHNISIGRIKHKAVLGEGLIGNEKVILAKPQTYMNLSGESVQELMCWYKEDISRLIVVYDDVDLDVGRIRIRPEGSSGTHNGMKSIIYILNTDRFPRIRIGIGKQPDYMDLADYVMGRFSDEEIPLMEEAVKNAALAIEETVKNGINSAMNKYNGEK
ncbi:MAG TPA: aminoacyl-tRNA hydrolase [Bacillota bacterium]|nr:aminoacyl-tRNA hydrolase [Bacillota bacterium]HOR85106.1 aminoacyl-tRNA hydrolase [Bacillota bacterium]